MTKLHRKKDIKLLQEKLNDIIVKAKKKEVDILEPTLKEYKYIMNYLEEFIKRKNRIIYGGWAWHNLLILKNKNEHIYHKDRISYPDIEFYSPDPIGDLIEICNFEH